MGIDNTTLILLLVPILMIQLVLVIRNLIHLKKRKKTKYLSKIIWVIIIILGNLVGNIVYLFLEGEQDDSD